jgi:UDP-3-O-[3-hydroxymyristoyl] glucosamine N-acyltransferase
MTEPRRRENGGEGLRLDEVARLVDGRLEGPPDQHVRDVRPLAQAGAGDLGFLSHDAYLKFLKGSAAGALLVRDSLVEALPPERPPLVVVKNPAIALARLLDALHPEPEIAPEIHPTAVIGRNVKLGEGVSIGPYAVLEEGAALGNHVRLAAHVVVGAGSRIGDGSVLHPHVVLYPFSTLGQRVILHSGTRVGVDGFGYAYHDGEHRKIRQVGGCSIGDDVEVGANSCIDRGSIGDTVVGAGTKIDNLVQLGHNVVVGRAAILVAQVGVSGSVQIGDGAVFGGQAGIAGHTEIGAGAMIAGQAGVIGDVPPGATVMGFPARPQREFLRAMASLFRLPDLVRRVGRIEKALGTGDAEAPEDESNGSETGSGGR